jgi:hypothetical protein
MSEQQEPGTTKACSLGLVKIPDNTFEHDMAVSSKYQTFSSEVLRLSLLGIAAIGFLLTNTLFKETSSSNQTNQSSVVLPAEFRYLVSLSLICLGVSVGFALLHNFFSADTLAWHLSIIRRELRKAEGDDAAADKERERRRKYLTREFRFKVASGVFLWLGAVVLAVSFITLI